MKTNRTQPAHAPTNGVETTAKASTPELNSCAQGKTHSALKQRISMSMARPAEDIKPSKDKRLHVVLATEEADWPSQLVAPKEYPNLVYLRLSQWQEIATPPREYRLTDCGFFVVPVQPWNEDYNFPAYPPVFVPCCHFLAVMARGKVPMPAHLPSQIFHGGFNHVLKTIEAMWPTAIRLLVSDSIEAPSGWLKYATPPTQR